MVPKSVLMALLLLVSGCATIPDGPSVRVYPPTGKPYDLFLSEEEYCRRVAERSIGITPRETMEQNTAAGTAIGAVVGTGLGAAIGAVSGNAGAGAVIGGISGGLVGAASGSDIGRMEGREAQYRYDSAYLQCMSAHGNTPASGLYYRPYRKVRVYRAPSPPAPVDSGYPPVFPPPGTPPPPDLR